MSGDEPGHPNQYKSKHQPSSSKAYWEALHGSGSGSAKGEGFVPAMQCPLVTKKADDEGRVLDEGGGGDGAEQAQR